MGLVGQLQRIMHLGFDWDTNDMSILLQAKLAKPLMGTARIVINSLHIKGDLLLMPVLNGKAILYSFLSVPEVRIGVAFGSGGSQALPATELPGVSSWLVKILTDTLVKTMVEPRRRCYTMPAVNLRKKAVGGIIYVTVISASKVSRNGLKGSPSRKQFDRSSDEQFVDKDLQTFVEVELEELTRKTGVKLGSNPSWNSKFNMVLHDETGNLRFNLYECTPNNVKYDYLASCEIKVKYVEDDSTIFWAIGPDSGVIAKQAEFCGKEVEFVVPFEGVNSGELTVKLVLKEWQFSDGSHVDNSLLTSRRSLFGSSNFLPKTGRKVNITVLEGKDLVSKDRSGKCDPYVKLQYGKILQRTRTAHDLNPVWNQKFEFDEIGEGEYLMIKCFNEDTFGDDNIGSARVNLEGLVEGSVRDVWIPLEKVNSGELRLQIESVRVEGSDGSRGSATGSSNGWVELVLIEAKDLIAADMRGTSDPYVRVEYGNLKKQTKVMYKTLNPQWNQTLEFPDDGSPLLLHVKDHNALLRASSIGDCVVEYQRLPPNQMADKWIPLQNVSRGEIHVQVTRRVPELEKRASLDSEPSINKAHKISSEMKQMMMKFQSLIDDGNIEGLATAMCELEALEDTQEEYMVQLETEQGLLLNKIKELGQEILNSSPSISSRFSGT
ncbi:extended synaptotagmin-1 isoform X2 [Pyrus x bretschneideri]|uniref:extended synaptotagmin-1 isoform X2 n=1 Tax=Pyrus x bretschneideri TaxID=225117 RepID=UPI00202E2467|nr:extended synaptotagmin-1 isoform X2 [Pyrus x bretschneideri]